MTTNRNHLVIALVAVLLLLSLGLALIIHSLRVRPEPVIPDSAVTAAPVRSDMRSRAPKRTRTEHTSSRYEHVPATQTRLIVAARNNDLPAVRKFIEEGDDINAISKDGNDAPALIYALFNRDDASYEIVKMLLDHGADANSAHGQRHTALVDALMHKSPRCAELLVQRGADPNRSARRNGTTALDMAKRQGDAEMNKLLQNPATRTAATGPATAP